MASRRKRYKLHGNSDDTSTDSDNGNANNETTPQGPAGQDPENGSNNRASIKLEKTYSIEKYRSLLDYFRDVQVLTSKESATFIADKIRLLAEFLVFG